MTVKGSSSRRRVRPSAAGSPPNSRLPERVGDQEHAGGSGAVVLRDEGPAERGRGAEQRQDLGGDRFPVEPPRLAASDDVRRGAHRARRSTRRSGSCASSRGNSAARPPSRGIRGRTGPARAAPDGSGSGNGKRAQQRVVEERERRGRRSDPQGSDEDRGRGEARRARAASAPCGARPGGGCRGARPGRWGRRRRRRRPRGRAARALPAAPLALRAKIASIGGPYSARKDAG